VNKKKSKHKLAVIGDSLSQGFNNGGIYRTDFNFPSFLAQCWKPEPEFTQPSFTAQAGIPINLEVLIRGLSDRYGDTIEWNEYLPAMAHLYSTLRRIKSYWEGELKTLNHPKKKTPYHNQSVWGFAINDTWMVNENESRRLIRSEPDSYSIFDMLPEHAMYVTASLVLNPSFHKEFTQASQLDNIRYLQNNGGIENLILATGHNNIIGAVSDLKFVLSEEEDLTNFPSNRQYTVYRPEHFEQEYRKLAEKVAQIGAQCVITQTIPYVTIPPVTRGINADKSRKGHRGYFDYYTRFWIWDEDFNPEQHPHLTKEQAIKLDQHVDEYNKIIRTVSKKYGWINVPLNKYLSGFARRRLGGKPKINLPQGFIDVLNNKPMTSHLLANPENPTLSTDYIRIDSESKKVVKGGLFSLDGIHPTTIGYGLIAHIYRKTMKNNGISFDKPLDWDFIIENDTLVTNPPYLLIELRDLLRFLSLDRQHKLSTVGNGLLNQLMNVFSPRDSQN